MGLARPAEVRRLHDASRHISPGLSCWSSASSANLNSYSTTGFVLPVQRVNAARTQLQLPCPTPQRRPAWQLARASQLEPASASSVMDIGALDGRGRRTAVRFVHGHQDVCRCDGFLTQRRRGRLVLDGQKGSELVATLLPRSVRTAGAALGAYDGFGRHRAVHEGYGRRRTLCTRSTGGGVNKRTNTRFLTIVRLRATSYIY